MKDPAYTVLVVEDDDDDFLLIRQALESPKSPLVLKRAADGVELFENLQEIQGGEENDNPTLPGLILLDLNMPKKDGRTALKELKTSSKWQRIPVVILTTSHSQEDIEQCYELGANTYVTKPVGLDDFISVVRLIRRYWFDAAALPGIDN